MAGFKNISIRNKLIIIQVATAFIAVLICCAFFLLNDIKAFRASEVRNKNSMAEVIGVNLISPLLFNDKNAAHEILRNLKSNPSILNAEVLDKSGKTFSVYNRTSEENFSFPKIISLTERRPGFMRQRYIVEYLIFQEQDFIGTLKLNAELQDMNVFIYGDIKVAVAVLFAGVFAAMIISVIFQKTISQRLLALVGKTKEVAETGNYSLRVSSAGKDEIGILTEEFNGLLAKTEKSENDLKEINSNLEKRIQERTAEVVKANGELTKENAERKKAEEQLAEKASLLQATFDSAIGGILAVDVNGKIVTLNKRFQELWGIPDEVLATKEDKKAIDFVLSQLKEPEKFISKVTELYGHPEMESFDVLEFKDGKILERYSMPEKLEEKIVGRVWNFIDVTARTKAEKELQQRSEELSRSNKELEQFAYVASHDLQEPLRTISNFVDLLEEKITETKDEESKHYITYILDATSRMQSLIKDLLDFSRVGRNPVFETVDCDKIVKEVIRDMDTSIKESNAKIISATLPILKGIEVELKRLFQNLISNAIKFRKKDVIPEINITVEEKKTEYLFAIKDNGIGIEEVHFKKLFIIFQRLHPSEEYPGTGIGLATCKKIVDLHNGKIWVESKLGEGSTFYFTIHK